MDRRSFCKAAAACGALTLVGSKTRRARAQAAAAPLPLFVHAHATGGWDVTLTFDPKSGPLYPINYFKQADYQQVGNFVLGPAAPGVVAFFTRYQQRILLLNGIYAATNNHDSGTLLSVSGSTALGFPCFSSLVAAASAPSASLGFVSGGGFSETAHQVAKTVVSASLPAVLGSLGAPAGGFDAVDGAAIAAATASQLAASQSRSNLPTRAAALRQLQNARAGFGSFASVFRVIEDLQANVPLVDGVGTAAGTFATMAGNPMFLEVQTALAGYVSGVTASANISNGVFDTHSAMYPTQVQSFDGVFAAIDYLWRGAAHLGITDRVFLTVGSDFSRPGYNIGTPDSVGKGHWQGTTSMLVMGPGITGNRVIGATSDGQNPDYSDTLNALPLNPVTLQPAAAGGVLMQREHVHYELRRVSGLLDHPLNDKFPLLMPDRPLELFT